MYKSDIQSGSGSRNAVESDVANMHVVVEMHN